MFFGKFCDGVDFLPAGVILALLVFEIATFVTFFCVFPLIKGAALFGAVRRVMCMKYADFVSFVITISLMAFFVALLLSGHCVRLLVRRRVIQCKLETFAEVFEVV